MKYLLTALLFTLPQISSAQTPCPNSKNHVRLISLNVDWMLLSGKTYSIGFEEENGNFTGIYLENQYKKDKSKVFTHVPIYTSTPKALFTIGDDNALVKVTYVGSKLTVFFKKDKSEDAYTRKFYTVNCSSKGCTVTDDEAGKVVKRALVKLNFSWGVPYGVDDFERQD